MPPENRFRNGAVTSKKTDGPLPPSLGSTGCGYAGLSDTTVIGACTMSRRAVGFPWPRPRRRMLRAGMKMDEQPIDPAPLRQAAEIAIDYLADLAERPVGRPIDPDALRATLGGDLPEPGEDPELVLQHLARDADPGLVATAGPRYFGFVIGGSLPVTVATEWLAAAWDQNAGNYPASPAMSVVEEVAGSWLRPLFGLPAPAR